MTAALPVQPIFQTLPPPSPARPIASPAIDHLVIRGKLLPDDDAPAGGVHPHHAHHPLLVLPLKQQGDPDQEDLLEDADDTDLHFVHVYVMTLTFGEFKSESDDTDK